MSALRFPSGPWTGFFTYRHTSGKCPMDLRLQFSNGRITGDGADSIGEFIIAGGYDDTAGDCFWTKTYVGAHEVIYTGFREGRGIWGTWKLDGGWTGGFEIWPLDGEVEELTATTEELDSPLEVIAPR